jgi:hypothetical protein
MSSQPELREDDGFAISHRITNAIHTRECHPEAKPKDLQFQRSRISNKSSLHNKSVILTLSNAKGKDLQFA